MDPLLFRADVEQVPASLTALARSLTAGELRWPLPARPRRVLLTGMGS